ncbi:MAG: DNA polymerase/3'-5' exonuclease PolX [Candidatus Kapabacteria bacterium]|jgi:DNA polymerase (family 10)|nr:DNA polymerase/3'-5' exonuclease PolX [Candidatus Kapabacteria bacterium]
MEPLVSLLYDIATLLELCDENSFKIRAIQSAARALEDADTAQMTLQDLLALPGVGKGTGELIAEFLETGSIAQYHALLEKVPESVLEITRLRGLGAKKVRALWQDLGVQSINDVQTAAEAGKIAALKGFGAKTQANIVEAIAQYRSAQSRFHQHKAMREAERLAEKLRSFADVQHVEIAGELRQGEETISQIVLVATTQNLPALQEHCRREPEEFGQGAWEQATMSFTSQNGIPVFIECVPPEQAIMRLHELSSSALFHAAMLERFAANSASTLDLADETEVYRRANLPYFPPELRIKPAHLQKEQFHEKLQNLIELQHLRGTVHVHTAWSDGKHTVRQMAERAKALGYEYIGICDHSKTAVYANGLSEERLKRQHEEIDSLNAENLGIRILKGIESDILTDGSLDYSDSVLETFDFVVASVHSAFTLSSEAMTARLIRALEHPATMILGHPTGRLLLKRKGYTFDWDAVLETAKQHKKILEINANPYRLDITPEIADRAHEMGILLSINTDAHNCDDLELMRYGVQVARRAALPKEAFANQRSCEEFLALA